MSLHVKLPITQLFYLGANPWHIVVIWHMCNEYVLFNIVKNNDPIFQYIKSYNTKTGLLIKIH